MESIRSKVKIKRGRRPKAQMQPTKFKGENQPVFEAKEQETFQKLFQNKSSQKFRETPAEYLQWIRQNSLVLGSGATLLPKMISLNEESENMSSSNGSRRRTGKEENNWSQKIEKSKVTNRESARNSRKRKKLYIELLEKKVVDIQLELNETKRKLAEQTRKPTPPIFSAFYEEREALFGNIERALKRNSPVSIEEISDFMRNLRANFGSDGEKRAEFIEEHFKEFIDSLLPFHLKYFLSVAQENKDIFSETLQNQENKKNKHTTFYSEFLKQEKVKLGSSMNLQVLKMNLMEEKHKMNK